MNKRWILWLLLTMLALSLALGACAVESPTTTDGGKGTSSDTTPGGEITSGEITTGGSVTTPGSTDTESPESSTSPSSDTPDTAPDGGRYVSVAVSSGDIYTGSLILVNSESPYCYKVASLRTPLELDRLSSAELSELGWTSLYNNKNGNYLLRSRLIFMRSEAYRAFDLMMANFVAKTGNKDVQVRFSYQLLNSAADAASLSDERVTGLVAEINVYTEEGTFSIDHVSKKASYYDWFAVNCHVYGFVMTGESGVFRYVGVPHATYMYRNDLDLEGYLALLKNYRYDKPLPVVDDSGKLWSVYYAPVQSGSLTEIKIRESSVYEISGNNRDGFIVASYVK